VLLRQEVVSGRRYLDVVTALLQRVRRGDPRYGLWEAADLQWWWRRPRQSDDAGQLLWRDGEGPVAAAVFTDWGRTWACDLVLPAGGAGELRDLVWERAVARMTELVPGGIEVAARDDDGWLLEALAGAGFAPAGESAVTAWLEAQCRPPVTPLPPGFRLVSRGDDGTRPHHLAASCGDDVAARLAECSLYQPDLDLRIEAPTGEVAAYGVFWPDAVTGVGLVEPMRTEAAFQRRGLARHLLAVGIDRLAQQGCLRIKVSYLAANLAAKRLYEGAGFRADFTARVYSPIAGLSARLGHRP
jgi:GNAT superfamily N-acetyltransferase